MLALALVLLAPPAPRLAPAPAQQALDDGAFVGGTRCADRGAVGCTDYAQAMVGVAWRLWNSPVSLFAAASVVSTPIEKSMKAGMALLGGVQVAPLSGGPQR